MQAQQQYDRAQDLKAKGFVSQSALDDAKRNLDVAKSQLEAARLQVDDQSARGQRFPRRADGARAGTRQRCSAAQARLDQTVIVAPVDGTLIGRNVEPGDVVQPGKELMVLAPAGETQIVVQIDEKNLVAAQARTEGARVGRRLSAASASRPSSSTSIPASTRCAARSR